MNETSTSVLQFKGKLTFEGIGILLNELKIRKEVYGIRPKLYKKLLTLMIEILENVLKYSEHFEDFILDHPEYFPEFEMNCNEEVYVLVARNPVLEKDQRVIAEKIDRLNRASDEEVKQVYRETITNGIFSEKGGAGLGFIEMAKLSSHDLVYSFHPAVDEYYVYELTIKINHTDSKDHG